MMTCAVPNCSTEAHGLCCTEHWFRVKPQTRKRLREAMQAYRSATEGGTHRIARGAYLQAHAAAIREASR